jgi:hypothetical protein
VGATIIGVLLFVLGVHTRGVVSHAVEGIAGTVLSVGLVVLVYELWLRRSVVAEFLVAANLQADLAATGILEVRSWGSILDWKGFFDEHPGDIDIVVSYGRTWCGNNADRVIQAAAQSGSRVTVTILNPNAQGSLLAFYAETYETTVDLLRSRITEVVTIWKEAAARVQTPPPAVRLEGINRHMPYTVYRSGTYMWVIFSARSGGRGGDAIPAILCRRNSHRDRSLYEWVTNDMQACRVSGQTTVLWETQ